jgi:membrane protease YdiL (CAAX protease family)
VQYTFEGLAHSDILPHCKFDQLGGLDYPFCAASFAIRGDWTLAVFSSGMRTARLGGHDHSDRRGRAGLRAFYRLTFRRVPFRWVIIAISTPPIVYLIREAIAAVFHPAPRFVLSLSTKDFNGTDLCSVSCEEPGWRGFALPRLIERLGANVGTVILGIAWALWHRPLFVVFGAAAVAAMLFHASGTCVRPRCGKPMRPYSPWGHGS